MKYTFMYLRSRQSQIIFQSEGQLNFTAEAPDLHGLKCGGGSHWFCKLWMRLTNDFWIPTWRKFWLSFLQNMTSV